MAMLNNSYGLRAFTLVEMMVALTILGIALTLGLVGWIQVLRGEKRVETQSTLDMEVRDSMERLRADMRESSLNYILFWPAGIGPYTAISFPIASTNLLNNGGTNIVWTQTVIYHVFPTSPNQLKRTVFYNRDQTASVSTRQNQLNQVVADGDGHNACIGQETYSTSVLFMNLFNWQLTPNTAQFDCYADTTMRDRFLFGSAVIGSGSHTVEFTVIGKNPLGNANYYIGIDLLNCSVSGSDQEAEDQPFTAIGSTPIIAKTYMPNGSWSGNYQLLAQCVSTQQGVKVTVQNDCWTETNFQTFGGVASNTCLDFDTTLTPYYDYVMKLSGATGLLWKAGGSSSSSDPQSQCNTSIRKNSQITPVNICMRVLVNGAYILQNGYGPVLIFAKCGANPVLLNPTIAIADNSSSNTFTCDAEPGSVQPLIFFQGGQAKNWVDCTYNPSDTYGTPVYAVPATPINIYSNQSYLISYYTQDIGGNHTMFNNEDDRFTNGCYVLTNATSANTADENWSSNLSLTTDCAYSYNANGSPGRIYSLYQMASCYASNGTYTSAIFDSGQSVATAKIVSWSNNVPTNTWCWLYARTGNQSDMSDATSWSNLTALATSGSFPNNTGRYIQFQSQMGVNLMAYAYPAYPPTPCLKSVSFTWPGDTKMLDVAGILTRGTDYAQCQVTVDGKPLTRSIKTDLTLYANVSLIGGGTEQFTSFASTEIFPLNTGK